MSSNATMALRVAARSARGLALRPAVGGMGMSRGFATEKQIAMRISATKNISKITQSMKMVSASKLRGDQNRLEAARPYNEWTAAVSGEPILLEDVDASSFPSNSLLVPITSDRGLCGGVNSVISRGVRKLTASLENEGKQYKLVVLGEKGRSAMARTYAETCDRSCQDLQVPYTFTTASALATEVLKSDCDAIYLIYNTFKSAIAYEPSIKRIDNLAKAAEEPMVAYEFEPDTKDEVLQDLYEYLLASQMYHSLMENATSEQSSRMNAMENASKNAGEMIQSLTLLYNRARQARITTELIEIISGASALED